MKKVIVISGLAGSGKTTAANYIEQKYNFKQLALGDKLKQLTFKLLKIFNVPIKSIDDLYNPIKKQEYRKYLQLIGTECCRSVFNSDFWCDQLIKEINNYDKIIISDVRFENEYNYFKNKYDITSIKIVRDGIKIMNHQSEQEINNIKSDYIIYNNSSISELYKLIDIIFYNL